MTFVVALAGTVEAQPAPQPLSILDVPFLSQSEALCGGAAAAMVLRYWGERALDAESFAHLVDRSAAGIRTTALIGELRGRGWNATAIAGTDSDVTRELARGRPVLALIQDRPGTFHYVVIVAALDRAVVFHDPARAPLRVMNREEFARRWADADRWMAVVVPGAPAADRDGIAVESVRVPAPEPESGCDALIAQGVRHAQANELSAAERSLAMALSCEGPAALRELAGVRLLQRRWPDVSELASAAVAVDASDAHAWRLLGTSRFVQNEPVAALEAWNRVGEPHLDLIRIQGLSRTRQRVVERLMGTPTGDVLTPETFTRARRRLGDLPSAQATRLEYVPVPSGLAELRAIVNERALFPSDAWSYAGIGLRAAASREVDISTGSLAGGGEQIGVAWRFWPARPRLALTIDSPAPWAGTWSAQAFGERQSFDRPDMPAADRRGGRISGSAWVTPAVKLVARAGVDRWRGTGAFGVAGGAISASTSGDRLAAAAGVDIWGGGASFALAQARVTARSSTVRRGRVYMAQAGAGVASSAAPPDLWFAGDTGHARDVLLRAHPALRDGRLVAGQLGRRVIHGSIEAQQWWTVSVSRIAAAVFVDSARVSERIDAGPRGDVDAGGGVRLALPGIRGIFRADLARGLRDGRTTLSFAYEP